MNHLFRLAVITLAAMSGLGTASAALVLYESAALGLSSRGGASISHNQFIGASFSLSQAAHVASIGGDIGTSLGSTIFGAIVPVPSAGAVPSVAPLQIESIALASAVFTADGNYPYTSDIRIDLSVDLAPGHYALIFGSGLFGATWLGFAGNENIPRPDSVAFTSDNLPPPVGFPDGRWNEGYYSTAWRLVVEGNTFEVSEPPSSLLVALALLAVPGTFGRTSVPWRRATAA